MKPGVVLRAAGALFWLWCTAASGGSFALIGDIPYGDGEVAALRIMLEEIGSDDTIAFVVHDGDIKSGSEPCDDARLIARKEDFDLSRHPFVLVPGDNEWTDCHRPSNGGYDPEERLARLRELFFAGNESLGRNRMRLSRQGDLQRRHAAYRENVRWEFEHVLFVGLNIPGSNNNWKNQGANREFFARLEANTAWLAAAFARARARGSRAVMVIIQANPDFDGAAGRPAARTGHRDGYAEFRDQLSREARAFGKPVVIVHGDTHAHRIDRPLKDATGAPVPNVIRLETFGSPALGWVKATIDASSPEVFRFEPRRFVPRP